MFLFHFIGTQTRKFNLKDFKLIWLQIANAKFVIILLKTKYIFLPKKKCREFIRDINKCEITKLYLQLPLNRLEQKMINNHKIANNKESGRREQYLKIY